jgi:hypothetical protein
MAARREDRLGREAGPLARERDGGYDDGKPPGLPVMLLPVRAGEG